MIKIMRPRYFLIGILLGFLTCSLVGKYISQVAQFSHFSRLFPAIQPQKQYYPTAHELLQTARSLANKDKIVVLIGGNSILRGVGQNSAELWSEQLQKVLGEKFKVINFAADSANLASMAGVVFRTLREEYPKIIFISTSFPELIDQVDGVDVYKYLFWDAYYKQLFIPTHSEQKTIQQLRKQQMKTSQGLELHVVSYLDSLFYFKNLWNWVGYHWFFTVWTDVSSKKPYRSRDQYRDSAKVDNKKNFEKVVSDPEYQRTSQESLMQFISRFVDVTQSGLVLHKDQLEYVQHSMETVFASQYQGKILCVLVNENPVYLKALPKKYYQAHTLLFSQIRALTETVGYHTVEIGQTFSAEDYVDGRHLSMSGGHKAAQQIAGEVLHMAEVNGY